MPSKIFGRGWTPDPPDYRDYTCKTESISCMYKKMGVENIEVVQPPKYVDLREWCSPIEDQGAFGSCTAHVGTGLIEFFIKKTYDKDFKASTFFLYKVTRNLLGYQDDMGAFLRDTMKAMVLFGVPPEAYCTLEDINDEPSAFCYALAQRYQADEYYRLDSPGTSPCGLLHHIKVTLSLQLPLMFGFNLYASIDEISKDGKIPFPTGSENFIGGHAVAAVGYDDNLEIENWRNEQKTTGALLIRNSWGESWGDKGYGWLPYDYVLKGFTEDWWSLLCNEWIDTGKFEMQAG